MPNYGTVSGVLTLYPRVGSVSAVTSAVTTTFLDHAEANIHGRIAGRYTVPVSGSPPLLKYTSETLALAMLLRRFFSQELENKSEWVSGMFEDVKQILDGIAAGSITIVDSSNVVIPSGRSSSQVWSNTKDYAPTMNLLDPIQQEIDPDRLDDIEEAME